MARSYAQFVVALVVVLSLIGGVVFTDGARAQTQPDVDTTVLRIELHENSTATWELQIWTRLRTPTDETEYRSFQQRFENDTGAYLDPFSERINGTVGAASEATGRQMTATGFEASTSLQSLPRQWGVVTYRFHWTNFAADTDGQLVVGDVFESGLFIAENDSLEVVAPAGYHVVSATPSPVERDDGVLTWDGPESFADGEPRVVFEPKPPEEASNMTTSTQSNGDGDGSLAGPLGAVFLVGLVAAGVWWRRSNSDSNDSAHSNDDAQLDNDTDANRSGATDTGGVQTTVTPDDSSRPRDEAHRGAETTLGTSSIVTDEDRVRTLLQASGGRVRQKDVVTELDWSKSKVSRVLSRMEDDGTIEKLRLGRENVIDLVAESDDDETDTEI
ncbi:MULTISPECIES: MarR family transcriptional regulator [Haloferax]|uniref:MarR family transcriptional regulator n=2 Tax=Haloferax TaxID=2251 RepID=A0A6G1Z3V6_9EURY|nr:MULTISPECIES: MarR family transcriptional regulator [Haloferax]KAB1188528.1 MarR family transcriptional regulator [Haloferax sp. CBA1149]MRW81222.1 MarR family transcriptional regulator [Haloferax marinisediminis]